MREDVFLIADLIVKQLRGELSAAEKEVLDGYLAKPLKRELWENLSNEKELNKKLSSLYDIDTGYWKQKAFEKLFPGVVLMGTRKKRHWHKLLLAASVVLVAVGIFWISKVLNRQQTQNVELSDNGIPPGTDKARLRLANGSTIKLNAEDSSSLKENDGTLIYNNHGELVYNATNTNNETMHNILSTERGGKFSIKLSDGTKVWLNSASSLSYPASFSGKERMVEISGEAYFQVAKNVKRPFVVKAGKIEIRVLGTEFNINSYKDESQIITTLLEGSISLYTDGAEKMLKPGQQARTDNQKLVIIDNANIDKAIAWRKGLIAMGGDDIKAVFREISRWYDVDVEFDGIVRPIKLYGDIPRTINLAEVLEAIQMNSDLHCEIVGKKVVVTQ